MSPIATVRVRVVVDVPVSSSWGADCTLGQIHAQATEAATTMVSNALTRGMRVVEAKACNIVVACEDKP